MEDESTLTEEHPLVAEHEALKTEHEALKESHAALLAENQDLKIRFGLAKKEYEWKEGDTKCQPVGMDQKCPECGWTADTKEPHPVRL